MNNTLTNEEIARVFAMYLGCDFWLCDNLEGNPVIERVTSAVISEIEKGDWLGRDDRPGELLLLTPLELISDEQIFELCKVVCEVAFGDYRYSKWRIEPDPKNNDTWISVDVKNDKSDYVFQIDLIDGEVRLYDDDDIDPTIVNHTYWQWYFQNGFAIPLYPWDKTAIELGIATKK